MKFGDQLPPTLPSAGVIRQALLEKRNGERLSCDYCESMILLKKQFPYFVRDNGIEKFFMHFWSSVQVGFYKKIQSTKPSLHIDATGGIVRPAPNIDGSTSPVFYYAATMKDIPVCQMFSARHTTAAISHWLMNWVKDVTLAAYSGDSSPTVMQSCIQRIVLQKTTC